MKRKCIKCFHFKEDEYVEGVCTLGPEHFTLCMPVKHYCGQFRKVGFFRRLFKEFFITLVKRS